MKRAIASIMLLLAMVANAGPFGYEMGQQIEGEPDAITKEGEQTKWVSHNVPAPFTNLLLVYMPNAGLCKLSASVVADDYDVQFDKLRVRLADKYGEPDVMTTRDSLWFDVGDDIGSILLHRDTARGFSTVMYIFTNYGDCDAEAAAMRQKDGLQDVL